MIRFFIWFVALLALLFGLELTPWLQRWFVEPWTGALAHISAMFVTGFDPGVSAAGKILRSTTSGFAVWIEACCNGGEATIVLIAAIFAFPWPWKRRHVGLADGVVGVEGLEIVVVVM